MNSQLDVYAPGTEPGNGTPAQQFGSEPISFPLVSATNSRNVTGQTLAPPNQLNVTPLNYLVSPNGTVRAANPEPDFDFRNFYEVGDRITLIEFYSWEFSRIIEYQTGTTGGGDDNPVFTPYDLYSRYNLSGEYFLQVVERDYVVVSSPTPGWAFLTADEELRTFAYQFGDSPTEYYIDRDAPPARGSWTRQGYIPAVQELFDGTVGPFRVPDGSTSGWVNLLAQNGIRLRRVL